MDIMEIDFFWIGLGITAFGYFIKEKDLHTYLNLSKAEVADLLNKHPNTPKVEVDGTTYYPYKPLMKWFTSTEIYQ